MDQLALDGLATTLFELPAVDDRSTVDGMGARVFSLDGRELCPSCASELKRGRCSRCELVGASAPALELEDEPA